MSQYNILTEARYSAKAWVKVRNAHAVRKLVAKVDEVAEIHLTGHVYPRESPDEFRIEFEGCNNMGDVHQAMREVVRWLKAHPEDYTP